MLTRCPECGMVQGIAMFDIVERIRAVARQCGWAIGVHGSMVRDIDLIGVPWAANATTPEMLVGSIMDAIGYDSRGHQLGNPRPGGRRSILLMHPDATFVQTEKGTWTPPCIDLSLMPSAPAQDAAPNTVLDRPGAAYHGGGERARKGGR